MYKQYLNDYEKRAEQIRKAAQTIEKSASGTAPILKVSKDSIETEGEKANNTGLFDYLKRFSSDDILLIILLFLLINSDNKDISLIITLGYLFLSGI